MGDEVVGRAWVLLVGGPLDGGRLEVTGWTTQQRAAGVALICDEGTGYGPGGRACYGPDPAEPDPGAASRWVWEGDTP
jgi:hypothetical protein